MKISQAFTNYGNPKGNADTERIMRTMKEELVWLNEWENPGLFFEALKNWIKYYNENYLHSTLNYISSSVFEQKCFSQNTPSLRAC